MVTEKQTSIVRLSIVIGLAAIVLFLVVFFFTGETGFLRTQVFPRADQTAELSGTDTCGPVRKIDYVELTQVTETLRTCLADAQRQCRAAGQTFASAENVRFGQVYPDESQDVYWDYVCY